MADIVRDPEGNSFHMDVVAGVVIVGKKDVKLIDRKNEVITWLKLKNTAEAKQVQMEINKVIDSAAEGELYQPDWVKLGINAAVGGAK